MGHEGTRALVELAATLMSIAVIGFPVFKIIKKAGYNGWWVVFGLVPIMNLLLLWAFAFAEWPNVKRTEAK